MNREPGLADPGNTLVACGPIAILPFARLVILGDQTREDLRVYGAPLPSATNSLAFLCDCDGPADQLRRDLAAHVEPGLRQIFSFCESFTPDSDLLRWMEEHEKPAATAYTNCLGRTARQVREESDLRAALDLQLQTRPPHMESPRTVCAPLRSFFSASHAT